eukprot:s498_g13.t1
MILVCFVAWIAVSQYVCWHVGTCIASESRKPKREAPMIAICVSLFLSLTENKAVSPSAARTSALEERLKELEKRLDAKETECKLLEQHLIEVRGCLEEQRERGARDLEQRDLHIQDFS